MSLYFCDRWCAKQLELLSQKNDSGHYEASANSEELKLVFDGYQPNSKL